MRNLGGMVRQVPWTCLLAWHELQHGESRRHAGQTVIETALVIANFALVAIPATQMLREGLASAYLLHSEALVLPSVAPTPTP